MCNWANENSPTKKITTLRVAILRLKLNLHTQLKILKN